MVSYVILYYLSIKTSPSLGAPALTGIYRVNVMKIWVLNSTWNLWRYHETPRLLYHCRGATYYCINEVHLWEEPSVLPGPKSWGAAQVLLFLSSFLFLNPWGKPLAHCSPDGYFSLCEIHTHRCLWTHFLIFPAPFLIT